MRINLTTDEIIKITESSSIREQAFFTSLRQSGLKPSTLKQLRIKHIERIQESDTPIPCKISIPNIIEENRFDEHPSFVAEEAVSYLKKYLTKRKLQDKEEVTSESLLFITRNKPQKQVSIKEIGRTFQKTAQEVTKRKSERFKLTILREFFKQKAEEIEHTHLVYLMGEAKEVDKSYEPEDDETYRKLYVDLAMDNLEIEILKPSQIRAQMQKETSELRERLQRIENTVFPPPPKTRTVSWEEAANEAKEWIEENPDLAKLEEEWYEQKVKEQTMLEELMIHNPRGFVAYTHNLKDKVEAIEIMLKSMRKKAENRK